MAKVILVANWKNHPGSLSEAQTLLKKLSQKRLLFKKVNLFIAPPSTYLESVMGRVKGFAQVASQDISALPKGTHTGEVTSEMLKSFGVRLSIIGHSERRAMGESTKDIAEKVRVALQSSITPLICFGEKEKDVEGEHFDILRQDLKTILGGLSKKEVGKIALAYEPVWAIGKSAKEAIDLNELSETLLFVRKVLADLFDRKVAEAMPILYGGSVEPANAKELMHAGVRGFLVGHASLNAKSFETIAREVTTK